MDATTIRVDRASHKGSVVDVAKMVLACDTDEAETACIKIGALPDEEQRRINGSGGLTAVAEVDMLIELVRLLPAEIPDDVRRQMSHTVCKLLKGDPKLVIETEKRHIAMREKCLRAGAQHDDMPAGFKHLSEEDREAFARQMVELSMKSRDQELQRGFQDLRRNNYELQEKGMSLKRKRTGSSIDQQCRTSFCAPKYARDSFNRTTSVESGFLFDTLPGAPRGEGLALPVAGGKDVGMGCCSGGFGVGKGLQRGVPQIE